MVGYGVGLLPGLGDDQHPAVELEDVHVVAVEGAQHLGPDDLVGRPARRPPPVT